MRLRDRAPRLGSYPQQIGAMGASLSLHPAPDLPARAGIEPAWNAQLTVGGTSLGRYWLGPRRAGPSYDADEQAQLGTLMQQAALALAYADTIEALNTLNRELEQRVAERTTQVLEQQRTLIAFEERQRLARELHDSVTQALFSIHLGARAIRGLMRQDVETATNELHALEQATRQALEEMRALLAQLRSPSERRTSETLVDFSSLLKEQWSHLRHQVGLTITLSQPASLLLPAPLATELLAIIKEALWNVRKHSGVQEATCSLTQDKAVINLIITDQGKGFELDTASTEAHHFGLQGMHERVASLGGTMEIRNEPTHGITLSLCPQVQLTTNRI